MLIVTLQSLSAQLKTYILASSLIYVNGLRTSIHHTLLDGNHHVPKYIQLAFSYAKDNRHYRWSLPYAVMAHGPTRQLHPLL